jgi:dephospho-CoA kinase
LKPPACDAVCVVIISEEEREKGPPRDNIDRERPAELESQMPQDEKMKRADYITDNPRHYTRDC